jgi:hypothetical protein
LIQRIKLEDVQAVEVAFGCADPSQVENRTFVEIESKTVLVAALHVEVALLVEVDAILGRVPRGHSNNK